MERQEKQGDVARVWGKLKNDPTRTRTKNPFVTGLKKYGRKEAHNKDEGNAVCH